MENKITALADKVRDGSITTATLKAFIEEQIPLIRKNKQNGSEKATESREANELEDVEVAEAYTVAHSLFERMVEERMMAEAILEEPEEWNFTQENKTEVAEGLRQHAEDFYKLAEKLLMVAWHGYERG